MPLKRQISPKQAAQALDVSEASVKRWCDRGMLVPTLTAGGHRRIAVAEVLRFVRARGAPLVNPEVLGLPSTTGDGALAFERAADEAVLAFRDGDEERVRRLFLNLYLGGRTAAEIGDLVVAPAFAAVGRGWESGEIHIFQERRAVELCLQALYTLESALPIPASRAPLALGGVLEGDPYVLGSKWCAAALHEIGWRAETYGIGLPAAELAAAVRRRRPKLVWLSVSSRHVAPEFFGAAVGLVHDAATEVGAVLVCGGAGMTPALAAAAPFARTGGDLRALTAYAATVAGAPVEPGPASAAARGAVRRRRQAKPRSDR